MRLNLSFFTGQLAQHTTPHVIEPPHSLQRLVSNGNEDIRPKMASILEDGDYSGYEGIGLDSIEKDGVLLRNDADLGKTSFEGRSKEKENERNSACNKAQNLRLLSDVGEFT